MTIVNEGRRVRIRPLREEDLPALARWKLDAGALSGFDTPAIRPEVRARRHLAEDGMISDECTILAVETVTDGRLVGRVGFFRDSPLHLTMRRTMSLIADPADRGHGYATEARILLVNYLFLSTALERVYSETEERNAPARRSLEKSGMRLEGVLRHLYFDQGRWQDMAVYSILRGEWESSDLYRPYRDPFLRPRVDAAH
jgi:ribosomal-protein-alanine N-acetyltransferase